VRVRIGSGILVSQDVLSSDGETVYTVRQFDDGSWECHPCPGFEYQRRADGLCKHIDKVKAAYAPPASFVRPGLSWQE
jgi:hypothetical protein